ncbi:DUF6164 family protein [Oceanobacter mangrovi]|uniref:DUF6164 family protein n=1 Tax=Oceanobacter mangrovi TaxID=2862510 RepID=UPI001C8D47E5|nr:DUF6164 family protein [Oceanobacter mangrovi]
MAKLVFHLNGVPQEEADQVRTTLDQHGISYYETNAGRWGISVAAIWLHHDEELAQARALIEEIQAELHNNPPAVPSFRQKFWQRPVDVVLAMIAVLIVLGLSLWPFLTAFND